MLIIESSSRWILVLLSDIFQHYGGRRGKLKISIEKSKFLGWSLASARNFCILLPIVLMNSSWNDGFDENFMHIVRSYCK